MKPLLIFSGANDRAVIAFCRYAESTNINYGIIANGEDDLIFLSSYATKVIATRTKNRLELQTFLDFVKLFKQTSAAEEVFVLPSTEYLNRFLLRNSLKLKEEHISFGLCNRDIYTAISDKYHFGYLCEKFQIRVPQRYEAKPSFFPYVAKPKTYFSRDECINFKPALIYNTHDEDKFLSEINSDEVYFQEYIGGKSIYLLFYFFKNKMYSVFSQENFIQQDNGGSMIYCESASHHLNEDLTAMYVELFTANNFHGLVMVEIKYYNGDYFMIEANPRLWGPSQLILDSKMTLFDDFAVENNLIPRKDTQTNDYVSQTAYFWSGGLKETEKKGLEPMYYDIDKENFLIKSSILSRNEVYNRDDTVKIYLKENS